MHATVAIAIGLYAISAGPESNYTRSITTASRVKQGAEEVPARVAQPKMDPHAHPYNHAAGRWPLTPPYLHHHPTYHLYRHPVFHHPLYHHPAYHEPYYPPQIHHPQGEPIGGWWNKHRLIHGTGDLFPHTEYYPQYHGHFAFLPHNYEALMLHRHVKQRLGGNPKHPYDYRRLDELFDRLGFGPETIVLPPEDEEDFGDLDPDSGVPVPSLEEDQPDESRRGRPQPAQSAEEPQLTDIQPIQADRRLLGVRPGVNQARRATPVLPDVSVALSRPAAKAAPPVAEVTEELPRQAPAQRVSLTESEVKEAAEDRGTVIQITDLSEPEDAESEQTQADDGDESPTNTLRFMNGSRRQRRTISLKPASENRSAQPATESNESTGTPQPEGSILRDNSLRGTKNGQIDRRPSKPFRASQTQHSTSTGGLDQLAIAVGQPQPPVAQRAVYLPATNETQTIQRTAAPAVETQAVQTQPAPTPEQVTEAAPAVAQEDRRNRGLLSRILTPWQRPAAQPKATESSAAPQQPAFWTLEEIQRSTKSKLRR